MTTWSFYAPSKNLQANDLSRGAGEQESLHKLAECKGRDRAVELLHRLRALEGDVLVVDRDGERLDPDDPFFSEPCRFSDIPP